LDFISAVMGINNGVTSSLYGKYVLHTVAPPTAGRRFIFFVESVRIASGCAFTGEERRDTAIRQNHITSLYRAQYSLPAETVSSPIGNLSRTRVPGIAV
jgi:hypothetical protein